MVFEAKGRIDIEDIPVELIRKRVRNMHLRVQAPDGRVRISAPLRMSLDTIRLFLLSKLGWIRKHQGRLREHPHATPLRYVEGEEHFVWGQPYRLRVVTAGRAGVELTADALILRVRSGATQGKREAVLEAWYRLQLQAAAAPLFRKWEPIMGVQVGALLLRRMRSRWGTCNTRTKSIRLNTELARKAPACLEYVVVHEMTHLLEASHNRRFIALMNRFMPDWAVHRKALNPRRPPA